MTWPNLIWLVMVLFLFGLGRWYSGRCRQKLKNRKKNGAIANDVSGEYVLVLLAICWPRIQTVQFVHEHDKLVFEVVDISSCVRRLPPPPSALPPSMPMIKIMYLLIHHRTCRLTDMSVNDAVAKLQLTLLTPATVLMKMCALALPHLIQVSWHISVQWFRENTLTVSISNHMVIHFHSIVLAAKHGLRQINRSVCLWNGLNVAHFARSYIPVVPGLISARCADALRTSPGRSHSRWTFRARELEIVLAWASIETDVVNTLTKFRHHPTDTSTRPDKSPKCAI